MARQTTYGRISDRPVLAGQQLAASGLHVFTRTAGAAAAKVVYVNVDAANDSTEYTLTIGSGPVSYTSDGSATVGEIRDGLIAAVNADEAAASIVYAAAVDADTLSLTGREIGSDFTFSEAEADLSSSTNTAADSGTAIPFGVGVVQSSSDANSCELPSLGTAKVMTAAPTAESSIEYSLNVQGDFDQDGINEVYTAVYTSDGSALAQEIVEAIAGILNANLPANTVAVTEDNTTLTFTGEVAGVNFEVTAGEGGSTADWTIATTTAAAREPFIGVALHTHIAEGSSTAAQYSATDAVNVGHNGEIWVLLDSGQDPTPGSSDVFLRCTAGASEQAGAFRVDADTTDAYRLPRCQWRSGAKTDINGNTVALLYVAA